MKTPIMDSYRPFQKFHPLTLLAQFYSRQVNGCLQVSHHSLSWFLYLNEGKLIYATNSINPFDRLDRHLRHLSLRVPSLVSAVRVQVRLLFDRPTDASQSTPLSPDYRAICWLVEQQHLTVEQAGVLIEGLAKEVVESFLSVQEATHELVPREEFEAYPELCQIDLRLLVEQCQNRVQQRYSPSPVPSTAIDRTLVSQNGFEPRTDFNSDGNPLKPSDDQSDTASVITESVPDRPLVSSSPLNASNLQSQELPVPTSKSTYTIACIDDSPTVLQAIRSFLDDKSFTVLMIDNPVKALMQIVRSKPDLILLDVTMPNLDGYELCSLLRKHPNFKHTPVIMVTGNTGFIDRAKAKLVGASGYLTKPFTQSDLVKMVFKHLT